MSPPNCIYDIFRVMGCVFKYLGFIALPGLYEKPDQSKFVRVLINYGLPLHFLLVYLALNYVTAKVTCDVNPERNLLDIIQIIMYISGAFRVLVLIHLYNVLVSQPLLNYLQRHSSIDELLRPQKQLVTLNVNLIFLLNYALAICILGTLNFADLCVYDVRTAIMLCLMVVYNAVYISATFSVQPQCMYMVFQHVLRCAFDELLRQMKVYESQMKGEKRRCEKDESQKMDEKRKIEQIRKFSNHYTNLCRLSIFLVFSFVTNLGVIIIILPDYAERTKQSASKILPAMFSLDDFIEPQFKTEINTFCLKHMYFTYEFTASGLFKINRELTVTMIHSLIPYIVVFYKLLNHMQ